MIYINDYPLSSLGVSVDYYGEETLSPEVRTSFKERGVFGSINHGATHGNTIFRFPCIIQSDDIRRGVKEVLKLFLDESGNYKEVIFKFSGWGDKYYRVMLSQPITLTPHNDTVGVFELEVTATFPFAFATSEFNFYRENVNLTEDTLTIPIAYYGTYRTGFHFSFYGTLSDFIIRVNFTNHDSLEFRYRSVQHNTFFECDFNKMVIKDNGNNGLLNSTGDFPYINRDTENITFIGDMSGSINLKYREIYV